MQYVCKSVYMCACAHVCAYMYVCMSVGVLSVYVADSVCMCVCVHVCVCMCMCLCTIRIVHLAVYCTLVSKLNDKVHRYV